MAFLRALTDFQVFFRFIPGMGRAGDGNNDSAFARAERRGQQMARELLDAYETLSVAEAAARLSLKEADIRALDRDRRLLGVTYREQRHYPAFQFEGGRILPGLAEVLHALDEIDGWTAFNFLVTEDLHLDGRTPLEALRRGDIEAACRAASAYGDHAPA